MLILWLLSLPYLGFAKSKFGPKKNENGRYIVDHEAWVMPGGDYNFYFPSTDSLGSFSGLFPEFFIF